MHAQDEETEVTPSVNFLDSEATTEEVDLFNNQGRILIMNIPNGMWEERGRVNLHAHNPHPQAPEHLSMVNNLTNDNAKKKIVHDGTNLTCISQPEWKKLRSRVRFSSILLVLLRSLLYDRARLIASSSSCTSDRLFPFLPLLQDTSFVLLLLFFFSFIPSLLYVVIVHT